MTERIEGRPDFEDHDFGRTYVKRFFPYVYSLLGGMLVHRVLTVEADWYRPVDSPTRGFGGALERLDSPRLTIRAVCGQTFYAGVHLKKERSRACLLPKPDAILCGRCAGTGPIFGKGLSERGVRRRDARLRIGCVVEVES